jgi:3',5'-cyclic AMP phosphodiesterase CpdA
VSEADVRDRGRTGRIAHLSDIHFGGENRDAVTAARDWINANRPDLTVISGDLTRFGQPQEFAAAADWVASVEGPRFLTPGNHDTPWAGVWERITAPFALYQSHFGEPCGGAWSDDIMTLAGVNTARGIQIRWNWSKGEISRKQTEQANRTLSARPAGGLGVMVCHHPLAEMVGGPMTARVRGGEAAAKRLCEGGTDLILTGHIHSPFAMALPYGDRHTYAVGASTLSVRERGSPAGFNVVAFDRDTIRVQALAWTGSTFEPWRDWTFPRRQAARPASA